MGRQGRHDFRRTGPARDVSRQAVAKAIDAGRLIAIAAGRTRQFPIWQFTFSDPAAVRAEVADVLRTFRAVYPTFDPSRSPAGP